MKRLFLLLPILAVLALVLPAGFAGAADPDWSSKLKTFKTQFKTKNPAKIRRKAVKALVKTNDARAVKEILKVVKAQQKHAQKLRKEWVREEEIWQKTTKDYETIVQRKFDQAQGGEVSVTREEGEWLGITEEFKDNPKFFSAKRRIEGLYTAVLEEEDLTPYIFRSIARLVNSLEGEDHEKAARDAAGAAKRAKADRKPYFIYMFACIRGDQATDALADFANDGNPQIVIRALEALGQQNSERGIDLLIKHLEDERWQARAAAIKGLSYYKDPRVMEALIAAAKAEEGVLQRKFFAAMARIVQERVPGTVEAWISFWRDNREDYIKRWAKRPKGQPIESDPPDIPIDTSLGSTSFYGIQTNSKHIIFVVDISGSMGEGGGKNEQDEFRIDVARRELKKAIQSLSATDEDARGAASFNIVVYATDVTVYKPGKMIVATKSAKEKANKWIDENVRAQKTIATQMTNIYDAVEQAFNIISDKKDAKNLKKGADTLFLMTDGAPNRGKFFVHEEILLRELKRLNETRKITVHTIGVGANHNRAFLGRLAAQNDGQYLSR